MLQEDEARRAQLQAAAEALVAWVHTRRDTRSALSPDAASQPILSSLDGISAPPIGPGGVEGAVPHDASPDVVDEPAPEPLEPAGPAVRFRIPADALRSLVAPVFRWSIRIVAVAALLAIVAGAGWLARPHVVGLLTVPKTGTVRLESAPSGSEILVDGVSVGTAPLTTELTPGPHVVLFRRRDGTRKLVIDVEAGRESVGRIDWSAVPTGRLMVRSDPDGARVLVDGRERGVTPLTLDDLTLGPHAVLLQTSQGSVSRRVTVTSEGEALVSESIYGGWLKLFAPFELQVMEGTRAFRVDDQNQILLPPGSHELRFENRALGFSETRRVEIEPGKTTSLSLVPSPSTLTVTSTTPAIVLIDSDQAGETPLTNHPVALGTREIVVRNAAGEERRYTRRVTASPVRIDVDFSRP